MSFITALFGTVKSHHQNRQTDKYFNFFFKLIFLGVRNFMCFVLKIAYNCLFVIYRERLHSSLRHGINRMKQHHDHLVSNLTFCRLFIDSNSGALVVSFFLYSFISFLPVQLICVVFVVHYLIDMLMSSNMLWVEKSKLILQNVFKRSNSRKSCLKCLKYLFNVTYAWI